MFDLRPYQAQALTAIQAKHAQGFTRQLVALPTGAGKTVLFSSLAHVRGPKALVIAHRSELITQAVEKLEYFYPGEVGILQADRRDLDAPVLVASIQTAKNHFPALALRSDRTLIIDEAHHAAAGTYRALAYHLGFMGQDPDRLLLGVTATPRRGDKVALSIMFETIAFRSSILDLISDGYLADLRGIQIKTQTDLSHVREVAGDFNAVDLAQAINTPARNRIIAQSLREYGTVPAVAFCGSVQHSLDLAAALVAEGFKTEALSGDTPPAERARILTALEAGYLDVVTNCNVLTEGFDCPPLRCLLMARPTKSSALYVQMIGRGTRLHPGKTECVVLDFNDNRPQVCTIATLTGFPIKAGETVKQARDRRARERQASKPPERVLSVTVEPFDLFRRSPFDWKQSTNGNWTLKTEAGLIVVFKTTDGRWAIGKGSNGFYGYPVKTLAEAFEKAERIAKQIKKTA